MAFSNSASRRYTPPTCTLQIVTRRSPLARWMGRSVTEQLHFDLRFDDPRLPDEQRVTIQGDRDQLEALHEAVTIYVQELLNQAPERFSTVLSVLKPSHPASPLYPLSPEGLPSSPDAIISSTPRALNLSADDSQVSRPQPLDPSSAAAVDSAALPQESTITSSRKIFLQPGKGLSHNLSLGSLANRETGPVISLSVLQLFDLANSLEQHAADLVALPSRRPQLATAPPAWASIAAVLLLAIGLTTVVQLLNRSSQQTASTNANQGTSSNGQEPPSALQPSQIPPLGVPTAPPVGSTFPPPNAIPSVVPGIGTTNIPQTAPVIPGAPKLNAPQTTPTIPITPPNPAPRQDRPTVSIPGEPTVPRRSEARSPSSVAPIPSPSPQVTDLDTILSQANRDNASTPKPTTTTQGDSTAQRQARSAQTTPNEPKGRVFDAIPQVGEAREYFKQRWEPPSSLTEPIQYSIELNSNGTIKTIVPLGKGARDYIDRTGMPLPNDEPFVSALKSRQNSRIRVVLYPDGKVETLME